MNQKYELLQNDTKQILGKTLYRVKALIAIGLYVSAGDLGGYVEKENNLSISGNAWVSGNALVSGDALVSGNALVSGDALVSGNASVSGNALVYGNASISGNALVSGNASVSLNTDIQWYSKVGSENGTLTVYKTKDGIELTRGCFQGSLKEFRIAVRSKYGEESKIGKNYLGICNLIAHWFDLNDQIEY